MDMTELHLELLRIHNLTESLIRSLQIQDEEHPGATDLELARLIDAELMKIADLVFAQP